MRRRIVYINLLILVLLVVLALRHVSAWQRFESENNLSSMIQASSGGAAEPRSLGLEDLDANRPFSEFMVIAEKNLFSEDRSPSEAEEATSSVVSEPAPKWAARPILHGVSTARGERQAVMTVFEGNKRNSEFRTVKVGNEVQGFQVAEIGDAEVKLRWNQREEVIQLGDASQTKPAAAAKAKSGQAAVTVITVGSPRQARAGRGRQARAEGQQAERGIDVAVVGGRAGQAGRGQPRGQGGQVAGQGRQQPGQRDPRTAPSAPGGQSPAMGLGGGSRQLNRGRTGASSNRLR